MAAVPALLAVAGAGASIYGGISSYQSARREAGMIEEQGRLEQKDAQTAAEQHALETRKFAAKQKLAFIKSGVRFEGSPLDVIDETLITGQREVNAMTERGNALARLRGEQAMNERARGRAALIGSFGNAASSLYYAQSTGAFGKKGE